MTRKLTKAGFAEIASKFRVLGDPVRLQILDLLRRDGESAVGEVAAQLGCSQPNASRQLSRLHEAGIIARRREGSAVFYRIEDLSIFDLCEAVCGRVERDATVRLDSLYEDPHPPRPAKVSSPK